MPRRRHGYCIQDNTIKFEDKTLPKLYTLAVTLTVADNGLEKILVLYDFLLDLGLMQSYYKAQLICKYTKYTCPPPYPQTFKSP
jgi:hypothetical protein